MSFNPALPPRAPGQPVGFAERWQLAVSGVLFGRQPSFDPGSPEVLRARQRWANPANRPSLRLLLWLIVAGAFLVWSWRGIDGDVLKLIREFADAQPIIEQFFDPDWSILNDAIDGTIVTVQMSVIGILGASLLSLPFGLMAARNISTGPSTSPRAYSGAWSAASPTSFGQSFSSSSLASDHSRARSLSSSARPAASESCTPRRSSRSTRDRSTPCAPRARQTSRASVWSVLPQAFPLILSYVLFLFWFTTATRRRSRCG